ncbi:MAG: sigma 54-interacting transcriptional regulator [Myxococcota bacterium]|nr:sigma 54-interacting transcriptional regulator [Myxococcota bacterium]
MFTVWIIHRDAQHRSALARIAGVGDHAVLGGPLDALFESAVPPKAILLGLGDDFEYELEFVHRFGERFPEAAWIVLASPADLDEARRLFDTLPGQFLSYPPQSADLRRVLREGIRRRSSESLSERRGRSRLQDRFGRWFSGIELPELMRALDPRLKQTPVLIRGEAGTGRSLLARYVHTFSSGPGPGFIHVNSQNITSAEGLLEEIRSAERANRGQTQTIWLEDLDHLPIAVQRQVQGWIQYGGPEGLGAPGVRFIAGVGDESELDIDPGLEVRCAESLAGITLRLPPLRERTGCIDAFVQTTSRAWTEAREERIRSWAPETLMLLRAYPWPGNMHELEAVVARTLSFTSAEPVLPVHLRFPGDSGWLDQYASPEAAVGDPSSIEPLSETTDHSREAPGGTFDEASLPEAQLLPDEPEEAWVMGNLESNPPADPEPEFDVFPQAAEPGSAMALAGEAMESVLAPNGGAPPPSPAGSREAARSELRQTIRALVHDVRNPLVSIRTFSELLPEHYDDPEFRDHFSELVGRDVNRIDEAVTRLHEIIDLTELKSAPVDIAHLLEQLLDDHREEIQDRRLLVLKELDHSGSYALGDGQLLRDAFSALIRRAIEAVDERGDVYLASRQHPNAQSERPTLRVLIRFSTEAGSAPGQATQLDLVMAQSIIRALGGTFTEDITDSGECLVVIDLPTQD